MPPLPVQPWMPLHCPVSPRPRPGWKLNHENIVKLYEFYEEKHFYYLVMEILNGGELFDRIVDKQYYNEKEARYVPVYARVFVRVLCYVMLYLVFAVSLRCCGRQRAQAVVAATHFFFCGD